MPYNIYETARLIQAVEGINPADSFLRDRYFPSNGTADIFNSEKVLCEYKDGDMRVAPIILQRQGGIALSRMAARMFEYEPPTVAPKRPLILDEVKVRGFGEALYGDKSPAQRAQIMVMQDLIELDNSITRREEVMAASTLLNNGCTMKAIGDDASKFEEYEVRFYEGDVNPASYAVAKKWDDPDADILGDLNAMASMLTRRGLAASDFVCAPDVADSVLNNNGVQRMLDNRRIEIGTAAPKLEATGAAVVCQLNVRGRIISIISYDQVYTDSDGSTKQYIPAGCGSMTAPNAGHTVYGAVTQVEQSDGEMHTYAKSRVPKYIADANADTRELRLTARPLCLPYNRDPFISAKSLTSE